MDGLGPQPMPQREVEVVVAAIAEPAAQRLQGFGQGVADLDRQGQHVPQRVQQDHHRKRHFAVRMAVGDHQLRAWKWNNTVIACSARVG